MAGVKEIPIFETERLILRAVTEADFDLYQRNFDDWEVVKYLSDAISWPYPEDGTRRFFEETVWPELGESRWLWGITLKNRPDEVIGNVDVWRECRPSNRGFWLAKKHWGKGLMMEALVPVMDYAFDVLNFDKMILGNAKVNERSRRIKEKTGARLLRIEDAGCVDRSVTEHEIWEQTKEDWLAFRKK